MNAENIKKIINLRHELHRHPELSMQEAETAGILVDFLQKNTSLTISRRSGWFYAVKRGTDSGSLPPIAFRADMDALPIPETLDLPYGSVHEGISHKCGHDGHCAALCGLALELDNIETDRDVYLLFQPGEETGAGALLCRDLLREKGIGEIYAFHNLGGYPEGGIVYRRGLTQPASEGLRIRLTGRTSHASAPEKGNNPAQALAEIVLFVQGLTGMAGTTGTVQMAQTTGMAGMAGTTGMTEMAQTTRITEMTGAIGTTGMAGSEQMAQTTRAAQMAETAGIKESAHGMRLCTITGIRLGSGDFGISPGEGEICMTLRAEAEEDLREMEKVVLDFTGETASSRGLKMSHSIHDYFPETRNHDACLDRVLDAARRLSHNRMEAAMPPSVPDRSASAARRKNHLAGHFISEKPAIPMRELWRASEDFGYYLKECPGAMFYIGNGGDYPGLHTTGYDFNDRILETAVDLFLKLVK